MARSTAAAESATAAEELRALDADDLLTRLREAKEELFNLRFQSATGQLDNNRRLHVVRRSIARIYTVMRERELGLYPAEPPTATTTETTAGSNA